MSRDLSREGLDARALGPRDLILSHFSLRRASFAERLDAAAGAGFAGVGLLIWEYEKLNKSGLDDASFARALRDRGLELAEIEALLGWAGDESARRQADAALETACHLARSFGARHLQMVGPYEGSVRDAATAFGAVCDRAAEVGLQVALEFLPFTNIPDAAAALEIAERADRPNGGLCFDTWHHFRGARDEGLLAAVPAERIVSVQLNDGLLAPENPDYLTDCLENRRVPGEGEFDLRGFLTRVAQTGARPPLSVEVISKELEALPAMEAARRLADGTRRLLPPER